MEMKTNLNLALLLALFGMACSCSKTPDVPLAFSGSSSQLKSTQVVPTLDTQVSKGKNVIWCASFLAAWKVLEHDLAGEPVLVEGAPQAAISLSTASDPRPVIPEDSLYNNSDSAATQTKISSKGTPDLPWANYRLTGHVLLPRSKPCVS